MKKYFSPDNLVLTLCLCVTCLWVAWGVIEMFHEGWYRPFEWLAFLLPAGICLTFTLLALTWPRLGGWLLILIGGAFYILICWRNAALYGLNLLSLLSWLPVSGILPLIGVLFLYVARRRRLTTTPPDPRWWRRNLRYLLVIGIPALLASVLAIEPAWRVAHRADDGYRGERPIAGNGVTLTWAPAGPGWQTSTQSHSWNEIALYGLPPVGFAGKRYGQAGQCNQNTNAGCASAIDQERYNLCRYLSADGSQLMSEPQGYWRLPTADELVRSLVRQGQNAGCTWNGQEGEQPCALRPDKETPLWDPKSPAIYYWSASERDAGSAYKVAYNGGVQALQKFTGLGSCGYRCVRDQ